MTPDEQQEHEKKQEPSQAAQVIVGLVVLAVLVGSGIWAVTALFGGGGDGLSEHEQQYVDAVYDAGPPAVRGLGDDRILEVGNAVCDDLAAGQAPTEVAADLSGINGPISDVAAELVAVAELHLCGQEGR